MKLLTAAEMREMDRQAIEEVGIPSLVLMENAGRSTYRVLKREFPELEGEVAVVAGRGNNGGDGFVVARYLAEAGFPAVVFLLGEKDRVSPDAAVNLKIFQHQGGEIIEVREEADLNPVIHRLARVSLIVDALMGTGLDSPLRGLMAELVEKLGHLRAPVLAVDMPTGISAATGEVLGVALKAEVTVTFGWPKLGQILPPGRDYVGCLWRADISIPAGLARGMPTELAAAAELRHLLTPRAPGSHKGTFGHAVLVAGSEGKTGAATLSSEGALKAGAGMVTLGVAHSLNDILEVKLTEAMTLPLPEAEGVRALGREAYEPLREFLEGKAVLGLGPGLGTHPETREVICRLVKELKLPMVIDADGLNCLAQDLTCLKEAAGPRILTPHPGEMARLVGSSIKEVEADRLKIARETAARLNVTLVLKGAQTVVATADGGVSVNSTGNPALASGGTGDVLTGLITGLVAQKLDPWDAARLGVYLHGLAADYYVTHFAARGMMAGDLLAVFPDVLTEFMEGTFPAVEEEVCLQRVIS